MGSTPPDDAGLLDRRQFLATAALATATVAIQPSGGGPARAAAPPLAATREAWYWHTVYPNKFGEWIGLRGAPAPLYLRGSIDLHRGVRGATLRLTGRERLRVAINGKPLTDLRYADQWDRISVLDVTRWLRAGRNVIAVRVDGAAERLSLLAELRGVNEDWTDFRLASDAEAWRASAERAPDWAQLHFDDSSWQTAQKVAPAFAPQGPPPRYELLSIEAPELALAGERVPVRLRWRVEHAAPVDHPLRLGLSLNSAWQGESHHRFASPASSWAPGDVVTIGALLPVPAYLKAGEYEIRCGASPYARVSTSGPPVKLRVESRAIGYSAALLPEPDTLFAVIADSHYVKDLEQPKYKNWRRHFRREVADLAVQQIGSLEPDFVLHLGDMVAGFPRWDDFEDQCETARSSYRRLACPTHYVAGNHDVGNPPYVASLYAGNPCDDDARSKYARWFGPDRYQLDLPGLRLLVANNNLCGTGSEAERQQFDWLQSCLAEPRDVPTVLAVHIPFFIGTPERTAPRGSYETIGQPERGRWLDLLEGSGVEVVYAGHMHFESTHTLGPTTFYTVPSTTFTRAHYPWCGFTPALMAVCEPKAGFHVARVYGDRLVSNVLFPYDGTEIPRTLQAGNRHPIRRLIGRKAEEIDQGAMGIVLSELPDTFFGDGAKTGPLDSLWHAPAQAGVKWALIEDDAALGFRHLWRERRPEMPPQVTRAFTTARARGVRYVVGVTPSEVDRDRLSAHLSWLASTLEEDVQALHLSPAGLDRKTYARSLRRARRAIGRRLELFAECPAAGFDPALLRHADRLLVSLAAEGSTIEQIESTIATLPREGHSLMLRLEGWDDPRTPLEERQQLLVGVFLAAHRAGMPMIFSPGRADDHGLVDLAYSPLPFWATCRTLATLFETEGRWVGGETRAGGGEPALFERRDGVRVLPLGTSRRRPDLSQTGPEKTWIVDALSGCIQRLEDKEGEAAGSELIGGRPLFLCSESG